MNVENKIRRFKIYVEKADKGDSARVVGRNQKTISRERKNRNDYVSNNYFPREKMFEQEQPISRERKNRNEYVGNNYFSRENMFEQESRKPRRIKSHSKKGTRKKGSKLSEYLMGCSSSEFVALQYKPKTSIKKRPRSCFVSSEPSAQQCPRCHYTKPIHPIHSVDDSDYSSANYVSTNHGSTTTNHVSTSTNDVCHKRKRKPRIEPTSIKFVDRQENNVRKHRKTRPSPYSVRKKDQRYTVPEFDPPEVSIIKTHRGKSSQHDQERKPSPCYESRRRKSKYKACSEQPDNAFNLPKTKLHSQNMNSTLFKPEENHHQSGMNSSRYKRNLHRPASNYSDQSSEWSNYSDRTLNAPSSRSCQCRSINVKANHGFKEEKSNYSIGSLSDLSNYSDRTLNAPSSNFCQCRSNNVKANDGFKDFKEKKTNRRKIIPREDIQHHSKGVRFSDYYSKLTYEPNQPLGSDSRFTEFIYKMKE